MNTKLTDRQLIVLNTIVNNPAISSAALTRKLCAFSIYEDERNGILDVLEHRDLIRRRVEPYIPGKRGRKQRTWMPTNCGVEAIHDSIERSRNR
jgi:hypothetical protein